MEEDSGGGGGGKRVGRVEEGGEACEALGHFHTTVCSDTTLYLPLLYISCLLNMDQTAFNLHTLPVSPRTTNSIISDVGSTYTTITKYR